jgi:DNA recombination protein RmuC
MIESLLILILLAVSASLLLIFRAKSSSENDNGSKALLEERQGRIHALEAALKAAEEELKGSHKLQAGSEAKLEALTAQKTALANEFKLIANEALKQQSEALRKQLQEGNSTQLDIVLGPLKEKLDIFGKRVQDTHDQSVKGRSELKSEVNKLVEANEKLKNEASELTRALRGDVKAQGNWGELVLDQLLAKSGLTQGVEYSVQTSKVGDDGNRYLPDVVVHLPDDKHLVIDSKVSLIAYDRYVNAENNEDADAALKDHILSIKAHIKGLSEKNYQNLYEQSLDFVLLFVPIESAYSLALQKDPSLFQQAYDKNIVFVTTTTLWSTLRTVGTLWKQEKQSENVREIVKQASSLYDKFVAFSEDLMTVGRQMDTAKGSYEKAMNKLTEGTGNLIRRTESLRKLGLKNSKQQHQSLVDRAIPEQLPESDIDNEG